MRLFHMSARPYELSENIEGPALCGELDSGELNPGNMILNIRTER